MVSSAAHRTISYRAIQLSTRDHAKFPERRRWVSFSHEITEDVRPFAVCRLRRRLNWSELRSWYRHVAFLVVRRHLQSGVFVRLHKDLKSKDRRWSSSAGLNVSIFPAIRARFVLPRPFFTICLHFSRRYRRSLPSEQAAFDVAKPITRAGGAGLSLGSVARQVNEASSAPSWLQIMSFLYSINFHGEWGIKSGRSKSVRWRGRHEIGVDLSRR